MNDRRHRAARKTAAPWADAPALPSLCRARDYLGAHYDDRLTLARGAREAHLSPFYFHRLFTRVFGETPHEFVTRLRIEQAKRLLLAGGHSVTEVCFQIGYDSLGSFSARFRALTGLSPSSFRREARRVFGGAGILWPRYYIPACFRSYFLGEQEPRSAAPLPRVDSEPHGDPVTQERDR